MIVDCHGHYTTAPQPLRDYRAQQIDALKNPAAAPLPSPRISDDQIRASLEGAQLKSQRERGTDLTLFSPIAGHQGVSTAQGQMNIVTSRFIVTKISSSLVALLASARDLPA